MADHDTHDHTGVTGVPSSTAPNPTTIELGHASDTTLARVSAGVISVEGNRIFAVGGADVPIADGGTGASTAANAFNALSPMTTSGDIIYGGASGAGTRLPKGTDGQVLVLASGLPSWGSAGAAASITYAQAACSADVSLTANTMADATGCSISLAAGTWLVFGTMCFNSGGSNGYCLVYLRDGANADYSSGRGYQTASKYLSIPIPPTIVTPGSTTTFKLSGQAETTGDAIKRYANGTVPATMIAAIKVA